MKLHFLIYTILGSMLMSCEEEKIIVPVTIEETETIRVDMEEEEEEVEDFICYFPYEQYPKYEHGMDSLVKLLSNRLPGFGRKCFEGKVFIGFTVEESGEATNLKMLKGFGSPYDEKILESIQPLPSFIPCAIGGKPAKFRMVIPVMYKY